MGVEAEKIRVLVVDDSPFMRMAITRMLEGHEGILVAGSARNGVEALEKIPLLAPHVITLDVEMPQMNGLETLKAIMAGPAPVPCIMVSSLTTEGADITLSSLDEGAVDFITKPSSLLGMDIAHLQRDLVEKIMVAARVSPHKLKARMALRRKEPPASLGKALAAPSGKRGVEVVLIGISTGGPPALQQIIPLLPADFPAAVVIAQHMPPGFTKSMADRLNRASKIEVKESEEGDVIIPGRVLVARSGMHLMFREKFGAKVAHISGKPAEEPYFPSVNVLLESAAELYGARALPVIMTGMGNDGTRGLKALKARNAFAIAQSEDTCAVFGMPKSAIEAGLIDRVAGLGEIPGAIAEEL